MFILIATIFFISLCRFKFSSGIILCLPEGLPF